MPDKKTAKTFSNAVSVHSLINVLTQFNIVTIMVKFYIADQQRALGHPCYNYNIIGSHEYINNYEIIIAIIFVI